MVTATYLRRKRGEAILCAGSLLACVILIAEVHSELSDHGISISFSFVNHQAGFSWPRQVCFLLVMGAVAASLRSLVHRSIAMALTLSAEVVVMNLSRSPNSSRHPTRALTPLGGPLSTLEGPASSTLRWEEFAARHSCSLESEPSIQKSMDAYRACGASINASAIRREVDHSAQYVGFSIQNQKAAAFGPHVGQWTHRTNPILSDLNALLDQVELPNVQFFAHLHDGTPFPAHTCKPVFAHEKSHAGAWVFMPPRSAAGFVQRAPAGGGELRSEEAIMRVAWHDNKIPFRSKIDKAFFRGSTTGGMYTKATWRSMVNPQPSTLDPQPSTLNTQHSTLNTQHSTLNTQHSTLNPQPSTLNPQPSTLKPRILEPSQVVL